MPFVIHLFDRVHLSGCFVHFLKCIHWVFCKFIGWFFLVNRNAFLCCWLTNASRLQFKFPFFSRPLAGVFAMWVSLCDLLLLFSLLFYMPLSTSTSSSFCLNQLNRTLHIEPKFRKSTRGCISVVGLLFFYFFFCFSLNLHTLTVLVLECARIFNRIKFRKTCDYDSLSFLNIALLAIGCCSWAEQ